MQEFMGEYLRLRLELERMARIEGVAFPVDAQEIVVDDWTYRLELANGRHWRLAVYDEDGVCLSGGSAGR